MENFSKKYADVQIRLLNLHKAAISYEDNAEQTVDDSQKLITIFSQTINAFCDLLADYLSAHHKNFTPGKNAQEIITNAHKAGFLAEHDAKILLNALKESAVKPAPEQESSLIHTIETYIETMQTIMSEIKP